MNMFRNSGAESASLSPQEIDARRPIWRVLAELWLDTVVDDAWIDHVAHVIAASPYSLRDVHEIHVCEVAPVVSANLFSMAGEWTDFDDDWLFDRCLRLAEERRSTWKRLRSVGMSLIVWHFTRDIWRQVKGRVDIMKNSGS